MSLSDEHRKVYEQSLEVAREEIGELDSQIEQELASIRERLIELQSARKSALQLYAAACGRLGIPNDFEDVEAPATDEP